MTVDNNPAAHWDPTNPKSRPRRVIQLAVFLDIVNLGKSQVHRFASAAAR